MTSLLPWLSGLALTTLAVANTYEIEEVPLVESAPRYGEAMDDGQAPEPPVLPLVEGG